jgi:hypothetical protein
MLETGNGEKRWHTPCGNGLTERGSGRPRTWDFETIKDKPMITAVKSSFACGIAIMGLLFLAANFQPVAPETVRVIVQAESVEAAIAVVRDAGGTVSRELGIIRSVSAEVTLAQRVRLETMPGVKVHESRKLSVT